MTPDQPEARKVIPIRLKPSIIRQARIAAVTAGKTLGLWLEEATVEKIEREK